MVYTAAATAGTSHRIAARSLRVVFFRPQCSPPALNPFGAVTEPPSTTLYKLATPIMSSVLWIYRGILQPEGFVPAHHQVQILDRLTSGSFNHIIDYRDNRYSVRACIYCKADITIVRAVDFLRRRPLPCWANTYEPATFIEMFI
ncbi:hypothetical protein D3C85_1439730 [compost metagenome]